MKLFIDRDFFDNPTPPNVYLCTTGKKIINQLPAYELSGDFKWGSYSEIQFSIDRQYVDVLTGETKIHPMFDKAEGLRKVYIENIGYFIIQDSDTAYGDKDSKTISCFSSEYETANKYLENFRVNTGEIDSKEVIALESIYGYNYTIDKDNLYKKASGEFDPYEIYYVKEHTDNDSYVYQEIQIENETKYKDYDGTTVAKTLYVTSYPNVRFYWPTRQELSLLHLVFEKIPGWQIGDVGTDLWREERTFNEDRIAVYDFLMNDIQDTFKCVVEWNTITNTVSFYKEAEDGITEDNTVQNRWDTDVFISRDNLANEININYSTDNIKTKLKVSGADSLDIREVNLGNNYIMNLSYYHNLDWMEQDLFEAYQAYLDAVELYTPQYTQAMQNWVGANNKYNDFMNAVPAEGNVVLVGDKFEKLYCLYTPQYEEGANQATIDAAINTAVDALTKKLTLYHINEDINASVTDNILLRLKNVDSDIATIRIYNGKEDGTAEDRPKNPEYKIQVVVTDAQSGTDREVKTYGLRDWVEGKLTAEGINWNTDPGDKIDLTDYTIQYIGVMGAYFVLAKDETQEATLEEYGVNLLKEKHKIYTTIFQTQTEAMFSQEKYQCIVQNEEPNGTYDVGTRWLDTNSNSVILKEYDGTQWNDISAKMSESDQKNYENYQRYIDNYEKMVAVQKVLIKKEKQAIYMGEGYAVSNRSINIDLYTNDNEQALQKDMRNAAEAHFIECTISMWSIDQDIPIYYFTMSGDSNTYAVYLKDTTPYVAYANSNGVFDSVKTWITKQANFERFFDEEQWVRLSPFIREDEFSDSNFLLNGYESEEQRLKICKELFESANKELNKICQPSLEFSMVMSNILALPEFEPLVNQFQLGNFVRVHIRDGYVKRARLLEVHLNFSDLSDFSCNFGNLVTTKSEIDKHAELLSQAVSAGKQVATSAGNWQRAVDKSNKLESEISGGFQNTAIQVGRANGQAISWDENGFRCRKFKDGSTDQYEDEQIAIINNKIVFTNDGWKTSKAVLGEFEIDVNGDGKDEKMYGLLADAVVSGYVKGSVIEGGSLMIGGNGGKFIVHENGSVEILAADIINDDGTVSPGESVYAKKSDLDSVSSAIQYHIELFYTGSTIFNAPGQQCILTCEVYKGNDNITSKLPSSTKYHWLKNGVSYTDTTEPKLTIANKDIDGNAIFACSVTFDDTQI